MDSSKSFTTIDEYITLFPKDIQERLEHMRKIIKEELPTEATEAISYNIPTFKYKGNLVHFAGYKNHIGFYPVPSGLAAFKEDLAPYKTTTGGVQFPHDKPLPVELIKKIVIFRLNEQNSK